MLDPQQFGQALAGHGFRFYAGVPCSFLKSLINYAINHETYISATNEGDAVATAAGASLAGEKAVVLLQNSGLGNAVSPLTSLTHTFKVPVLVVVSWRGGPGHSDEPQHELMGRITSSMLETMAIETEVLAETHEAVAEQLERANACIEGGQSFALVVPKGRFDQHQLQNTQSAAPQDWDGDINEQKTPIANRTEALNTINNHPTNGVVLATTGKTGRELFEVQDRPNYFYQVGSMGCISALGLGIALNKPNLPVIVIDGDGAALMRLGSWATNGFYAPKNLCHILLDNDAHDSTGGQATASTAIKFPEAAKSMNYARTISVSSLEQLKDELKAWESSPKLSLIHVKITTGSPSDLGRPTITPEEVATRFKRYIKDATT